MTIHILRGRYEDSVDTADRRHKDRMKAEHNEQIALAEKEQWILRCLNVEAEVERLKADNATAIRLMAELWNCADEWHGVRASSHYRSDLVERMRNLAKLGNRWPERGAP